jgi:hypothetical protein
LDDITARAAAWCEQARGLGGSVIGDAMGDGAPRAPGGAEALAARLDAIREGLRLRRRLDGLVPDEETESVRHQVVCRLIELERAAGEELAGLMPGTPRYREVAARVRDGLSEARVAAQNVLTVLQFEPLHQAMAIAGLRVDLEWWSLLVARLDGEVPPAPSAWLDVELEHVRTGLGPPGDRDPDPRDEPIRARCERMRAVLLGRRVRRELTRPLRDAGPAPLWVHRFHLSRLQSHAAALELAPAGVGAGPAGWLEDLSRRRRELADAADDRMATLPLSGRRRAGTELVQAAIDEVGEVIAFLEQMPPRRAVSRLELARDDLERLAGSFRLWARESPPQPASESAEAPEPHPDGALGPTAVAPPGPEAAADGDDRGESAEARADERAADERDALAALRRRARRVERLAARARAEWQEKVLSIRMEALLGRRAVAVLENAVLALIPVLIGLIAAQALLERAGPLSIAQHRFFAWADLAICSVFLLEFGLKLALAPERGSYLLRHWLIDLVASLPFGFVAHQIDLAGPATPAAAAAQPGTLGRLAGLGRLAQVLRFARLLLPIARLVRVALILLRLSDRLVRRLAGLLNRNIILFEPSSAQRPESSDRHHLVTLRAELDHARTAVEGRLDRDQRRRLAARILADFDCQIVGLPTPAVEGGGPEEEREIPVDAVVERLIQMTPEQLVDRMGPAFVVAVDRYIRLLDVPVIRRLPIVRSLVIYREKSPAEAVAMAANHVGHLIQRGLDVAYFLADLQGTLSPPVFLDRLGATIVNATRTPAKRLLWLGSAFFVLYLAVRFVAFLQPVRAAVDKIQALLGWPVIILGVICLVFWSLGAWFRRIANQSADFSERVVEAQFAAHTKGLKSRRRDQDAQFLAERVIDPELLLRSSDDRTTPPPGGTGADDSSDGSARPGWFLFEDRELAFLRNVRLLYQDYLDGSPLHRSDTKASIQLLGNLALSNLRRSHLQHLLRESRMLDRLDLSRAGGLFGGPYLWFNYITRMLVQETALLILDYNRHAIPVDRLACSPAPVRDRFRAWLAGRLKVDPEEIWLPDPVGGDGLDGPGHRPGAVEPPGPMPATPPRGPAAVPASGPAPPVERGSGGRVQPTGRGASPSPGPGRSRRKEAEAFLETVEFTAVDFLADEPDRDAEIGSRFGPQVAELVRRDRQQNVRRAFRSFPLHELPAASRTINPFTLYETYLAGGRVILLPAYVLGALARAAWIAVRGVYRVVHEILHPRVDQERTVPPDAYWAALRKIHRMRKPVFMGSLWLRARFDVEYLGLALPTAPAGIAGEALMEADLDYIGATRQDRSIAERVRHQHQRRLEWVGRWLRRFGWTFDELPRYLAREIPYLANRGGEALRALVAACILDHDDMATLALAIEGLERVLAQASDPSRSVKDLPAGLPEPVVSLRALWHPVHRCRRPVTDLFGLPCFPAYDLAQRRRILRYLRRHRRTVRGWVKVVLGQGGVDPWATVGARMRDVLLRTDLWSDQILVLRAVQTLTMLDLQHNCELVWSLGGYTAAEPGTADPDARPPGSLLHREDRPVPDPR